MNEELFVQELKKNGIDLSEKQLKQYQRYYELLVEWNEKMNLTTILKKEEVYEKHFYDSLTIAFNQNMDNKKLLDIGAGAGLPSLALKIAFPTLDVTIMDSVAKKMTFVDAVIKELGLSNARTVAARAEEYIVDHREEFDIVTARAVCRMNMLVELATPYLKVGGLLMALKGAIGDEEIRECGKAFDILHLVLVDHKYITLPVENSSRHNYYIKKVEKTNQKYPRRYSLIKGKPV